LGDKDEEEDEDSYHPEEKECDEDDDEEKVARAMWYHRVARELDVRMHLEAQRLWESLMRGSYHKEEDTPTNTSRTCRQLAGAARDFFCFPLEAQAKETIGKRYDENPSIRSFARRDDTDRDHDSNGDEDDDDDEERRNEEYFSLEGCSLGDCGAFGAANWPAVSTTSGYAVRRKRRREEPVLEPELSKANPGVLFRRHREMLPVLLVELRFADDGLGDSSGPIVIGGYASFLDVRTVCVPAGIRALQRLRPRSCPVWLDLSEAGSGGSGVKGGIGDGFSDPGVSTSAVGVTSESRWKLELLRQCLVQEERQSEWWETATPRNISSAASASSITERIAEWASKTSWFDDICVFVVADGCGASVAPPWKKLVDWLAYARQFHGLPFKAVIIGGADSACSSWLSPSALSSSVTLDLSSCAAGMLSRGPHGGLQRGTSTTVVSSAAHSAIRYKQDLAHSFLRPGSHVVSMFMSSVVAASAKAAVAASNASTDDMVAHNVPHPRVPSLSLDEERRLQWYLLDLQARRYLGEPPEWDGATVYNNKAPASLPWLHHLVLYVAKLEIAAQLDAIMLHPQDSSGGVRCSIVSAENKVFPDPGSDRQFFDDLENVLRYLESLRNRFRREKPGKNSKDDHQLAIFGRFQDPVWRRLFFLNKDRNAAVNLSIRHIINQLIVVVGKLTLESALVVGPQGSEVFIDKDERKMVRAILHRALFHSAHVLFSKRLAALDEFYGAKTPRCPSWSMDPHTRRDLVSGLALEATRSPAGTEPSSLISNCAPFLAGTLYRLILPLVSISQEDWFALWHQYFHDRVLERNLVDQPGDEDDGSSDPAFHADDYSVQELFIAFRCGVLQLKYLGLIKERQAPSGAAVGSGGSSVSTSQGRRPHDSTGNRVVYDKPVLVWCGGD
jgi:hypothetical protein